MQDGSDCKEVKERQSTDDDADNEAESSRLEQRLREVRQRWLGDASSQGIADEDDIESIYWDLYNRTQSRLHPSIECIHESAGGRLALLLLQRSCSDPKESSSASPQKRQRREHTADGILRELGYHCRLASNIFDYAGEDNSQALGIAQSNESSSAVASRSIPCRIFDDALTVNQLRSLQNVFSDPQASYWSVHNYQVEPPSPYFSYVVPLKENGESSFDHLPADFGSLGSCIHAILRLLEDWKPNVTKQANYCEMWAHNRPGVTGHQLHFDSDNEGKSCTASTSSTTRGAHQDDNHFQSTAGANVKHPLITAIVYLTGVGGPTLVTNQRLASQRVADRGWLAYPRTNRLVLMDGRVLHCVIPGKRSTGKPYSSHRVDCESSFMPTRDGRRRVSVMLAFWKRLRVRDEGFPGAARPLPAHSQRRSNDSCNAVAIPTWASDLVAPLPRDADRDEVHCVPDRSEIDPICLSRVYETLDSGLWTREMGIPAYDQVFQGI